MSCNVKYLNRSFNFILAHSREKSRQHIQNMAAQTQNIQKLLQAEKRAQDIISQARHKKNQKLKQAKDEAKVEVLNYKKEREQNFKNLEAQILGDKTNNEVIMQQRTEQQINEMQQRVVENQSKVSELVIGIVCDVRPKLHVNYDGKN